MGNYTQCMRICKQLSCQIIVCSKLWHRKDSTLSASAGTIRRGTRLSTLLTTLILCGLVFYGFVYSESTRMINFGRYANIRGGGGFDHIHHVIPHDRPIAVVISPMKRSSFISLSSPFPNWYHAIESIVHTLSESIKSIWRLDGSHKIYLIFQDRYIPGELGPIGLFFWSSILLGGVFHDITVGWARSVEHIRPVQRSLGSVQSNATLILASDFEVLYRSKRSEEGYLHFEPILKQHEPIRVQYFDMLLYATINQDKGGNPSHHWFGHISEFLDFRKAVWRSCSLPYEDELSVLDSSGRLPSSLQPQRHGRLLREPKLAQTEEDLRNISAILAGVSTPPNGTFDDFNLAFQKDDHYWTRWQGHPLFVYATVKLRDRLLQKWSAYSNIYTPLVKILDRSFKKVLIYNRDSSRVLTNDMEAVVRLRRLLNEPTQNNSSNSISRRASHNGNSSSSDEYVSAIARSALRWTVQLIKHSKQRPICSVLKEVRTATVLIGPHGFQHTLVLFQPLASTLVEVFPYFYIMPDFYGSLNVGLRERYAVPRAYFFDSSMGARGNAGAIETAWLKFLNGVKYFRPFFRYFGRVQNVKVSDETIRRTAESIKRLYI